MWNVVFLEQGDFVACNSPCALCAVGNPRVGVLVPAYRHNASQCFVDEVPYIACFTMTQEAEG